MNMNVNNDDSDSDDDIDSSDSDDGEESVLRLMGYKHIYVIQPKSHSDTY